MLALMARSMALPVSRSSLRKPSSSENPSVRCSVTSLSKFPLRSVSVCRSAALSSDRMPPAERSIKARLLLASLSRCSEGVDQRAVRRHGEILGGDAHGRDRDLEFAAGVGQLPCALGGIEGGGDAAFAGNVSDAVGEEADQRDQRQRHDAGAHRQRAGQSEQPSQGR